MGQNTSFRRVTPLAFQVILTIFTSNQRGFKVKRKKPEESQVGPRNEAAKRGEVPVNKEDESTDSGQPMSSDSDQPILPGAPSKHTCFRLLLSWKNLQKKVDFFDSIFLKQGNTLKPILA